MAVFVWRGEHSTAGWLPLLQLLEEREKKRCEITGMPMIPNLSHKPFFLFTFWKVAKVSFTKRRKKVKKGNGGVGYWKREDFTMI